MEKVEIKEHLDQGGLIIKTRDHRVPLYVPFDDQSEGTAADFEFQKLDQCPRTNNHSDVPNIVQSRRTIKPWITALSQTEHVSLLIGSGLTCATHSIATEQSVSVMETIKFDVLREKITKEAARVAARAGRTSGNFEDQVRVANELLRGLEILSVNEGEENEDYKKKELLRENLKSALDSFSTSILQTERLFIEASRDKLERAFSHLVNFLLSFANRSGKFERLHIFTTNYDRFIELGADIAGLRLVDRFVGTIVPIFRASKLNVDLHYNPPGIRGEPRYLEGVAQFTKLHGSIDWVDCGRKIRKIGLPFGTRGDFPFVCDPDLKDASSMNLMVYPNSTKDRETAEYPYVELFRDFAAAICQPNSTVFCYGYSFGDEHINRVLADMLTIPSTHLVIISYDDPLGRIMDNYEKIGRPSQMTLLIGHHFGELRTLNEYLPTPTVDRTTLRMTEFLNTQHSIDVHSSETSQKHTSDDEQFK